MNAVIWERAIVSGCGRKIGFRSLISAESAKFLLGLSTPQSTPYTSLYNPAAYALAKTATE